KSKASAPSRARRRSRRTIGPWWAFSTRGLFHRLDRRHRPQPPCSAGLFRQPCKNCNGALRACLLFFLINFRAARRHTDSGYRARARERTLGTADQATVRSATRTFPFVSGLKRTATRKSAKPTTVVTRIGPESVIWWVVAY